MTTKEYLDAIRALTATGSVYAAAQLLGIEEQTVRNWATGTRYPDAFGCMKLAEALDLPIEQVLADVNAEKEKDPERRAYWEGLARKFAACVVMGLGTTTWPTDGHSATGQAIVNAGGAFFTMYELCVKWWIALRRRRSPATGWLVGMAGSRHAATPSY